MPSSDLHRPSPADAPPRLLRAVFLLAALAVVTRWIFQAVTGLTMEDALISLRYAENLAAGHGMVYNVDERVFGASTPLYVLLLAGLTRLQLPALAVAKTLAALADGATLFLWGRWLLRETGKGWAALLFGVTFALSPVMVEISVCGMETSFALLLLTLALLADLEERPLRCGLVLGLLMLVRPDGALAAAVVLGLRAWRTGRIPWRAGLAAAAVLLPWLLIATAYYGSPVPNSIPAKAAAYNLHRPSMLPNLWDTVGRLGPTRGPFGSLLANLVLFPCLAIGVWEAWAVRRLRPLAALFLAWWAYLVVPKTLLFPWYLPPLLLPAYVLAALGFDHWLKQPRRRPSPALALCAVGIGLVSWLWWVGERDIRRQRAELHVRRGVGLWLRENTPPDARVALEPIGYIGYYSRRKLLDEVGLVSPQMVPLNRAGAGWFAEMLERFAPDYVVERPHYLVRNRTLNTEVPMFRTAAEREGFVARYTAVANFGTTQVTASLVKDYTFVIYARREPESARAWAEHWARLATPEREALLYRALTGLVEPHPPAAKPAAPRRR